MSWLFVSKNEFEQLRKENEQLVESNRILSDSPTSEQTSEARRRGESWPLVSKWRYKRLQRENEKLTKVNNELLERFRRKLGASSAYRSRNDSDAAMC